MKRTLKAPVTLRSLIAGFEFAWNKQVVLGAMMLDTVVVMFAGIVLLVWPELHMGEGTTFLVGVGATQVASVGWAFGSMYSRRRRAGGWSASTSWRSSRWPGSSSSPSTSSTPRRLTV